MAMAVGDVIVSCCVWIVLILLLMLLLGPLIFRHAWRPYRIRTIKNQIRQGRRALVHPVHAKDTARVEAFVNAPVYLHRGHHARLHLDMEKDGYSLVSQLIAKRKKEGGEKDAS